MIGIMNRMVNHFMHLSGDSSIVGGSDIDDDDYNDHDDSDGGWDAVLSFICLQQHDYSANFDLI